MKEYRLQQDPETLEGFDLCAVCLAPAKRVCEHFAIRLTPQYHDAGEGLMVEAFTLDHVASGKKVLGGDWERPSEEECMAFAKSLASAPVDWSCEEPETPEGFSDFFRAAKRARHRCESLNWGEWVREQP